MNFGDKRCRIKDLIPSFFRCVTFAVTSPSEPLFPHLSNEVRNSTKLEKRGVRISEFICKEGPCKVLHHPELIIMVISSEYSWSHSRALLLLSAGLFLEEGDLLSSACGRTKFPSILDLSAPAPESVQHDFSTQGAWTIEDWTVKNILWRSHSQPPSGGCD